MADDQFHHRRTLHVAAVAAALGILGPLMIVGFITSCCYQPQWPEAAEGPLPQSRFVDHILILSQKVLWPTATAFLSPTVDRYQNAQWLFYYDATAAIAANGVLFGFAGAATYLIGRSLQGNPDSDQRGQYDFIRSHFRRKLIIGKQACRSFKTERLEYARSSELIRLYAPGLQVGTDH